MSEAITRMQAASVKARGGAGPIFYGLLALVVFVAWSFVSLLEIQTSEALFLNDHSTLHFGWGLLNQVGGLLSGNYTGIYLEAIIAAWVIQLFTVIIGIGYEHTSFIGGRSSLMSKVFLVGSLVLLGYNFLSDYNYSMLPSGAWGQFFFSLAMALMAAFGFPVVANLAERAFMAFNK